MMILALAAAAQTLSANNFAVSAPMHAPPGAPSWSDEFSGPALDLSKWSYDTAFNKKGWFNGELEYYSAGRPENLRIENGVLVIEAREDGDALSKRPDWGGQHYTSAKIFSRSKADFRYGFVEVRAKLPCTEGTWPAIWMMPEGSEPWPNGGEIDIMEHVGSQPHVVHGTLHTRLFNHQIHTGRGAEYPVATSCEAFHRYQMDWQPHAITIGVDDHAYMQVRDDQPGGRGAWPFTTPFYMILNLALGG
ncbi:glycoside hydrolase family 16 protein, partial [Sphingomonas sp.]|uniref:glycoside hydrolase family 16 protein n=1 Tax=Sphingomonas sp. TaxID=28214 RepID=UPI0025EC2C87